MSVVLRPLDAFAELCFHGLAHLPFADPGSSYAPDYVAWAATHGLSNAQTRADGEQIAALVAPGHRGLLHAWLGLHHTLDDARRTRTRSLAELEASDVDDEALLRALQRADDPALEWMHVLLGLELPAWSRAHAAAIAEPLARACETLAPLFTAACVRVPSLAGLRIELSWTLGPRARAHPDRLIVGAPAPWHDGAAAQSVVLALHEHAVRDLSVGDWAEVEWSALRHVSAWLAQDSSVLAQAHALWLERLDLRGLLEALQARGAIDPPIVQALLEVPQRRAQTLLGPI